VGAVAVAGDQLRIVVGAGTDVGGRTENEDAVLVAALPPVGDPLDATESGQLLAVADGMGGYQRGEVASQIAIETIRRMFAEDPGADHAPLLKQAYRQANRAIYENGRGADGNGGMMGTTLVVATTRGKYLTIANIGDSRAYLVRANRLQQVTRDHSLVAEQVSQGALSAAEARESPHRNIITQALGHRERLDTKMPDIFEITLLAEDRLLLCSDGFYDVVADDDLIRVLLDHEPEPAARRLIEMAVERGTTDNVSAVVVGVQPARIRERELVGAGAAPSGRGSFLLPALALLAAIVFIALVLLVLTVL